jgi:hypothetical protein
MTKTLLDLKDKLILFVGDSLTGEMSMTMRCMIESHLGNNSKIITITRSSTFLGNFSYSNKYLAPGDPTEHLYSRLSLFDNIKKTILSQRKKKSFVVFNTGPWWSSTFVKSKNSSSRKLNQTELIDAFQDHFNQSSPFMKQMKKLVNNDELRKKSFLVVPIWRDNLPAGICADKKTVKVHYDYHNLFQIYNRIARESFLSNSYFIIPDVWNASLSRFNNHMLEHDDFLHYCAFRENTVFWMANIQLLRLIESFDS